MIKLAIGKEGETKINLFNSIEELPIKRYIAFQKYSLLDACVGSTFADVIRHFEKIDYFLEHNKVNEAKQERLNQHTAMYLQVQEMNTKMLSFACLVESINGTIYRDFTEEGLQETSEKLQETELTTGKIDELLSSLKKKLIQN